MKANVGMLKRLLANIDDSTPIIGLIRGESWDITESIAIQKNCPNGTLDNIMIVLGCPNHYGLLHNWEENQ